MRRPGKEFHTMINVSMPVSLALKIEDEASKNQMSMSALISDIVKEYYANSNKKEKK